MEYRSVSHSFSFFWLVIALTQKNLHLFTGIHLPERSSFCWDLWGYLVQEASALAYNRLFLKALLRLGEG